MSYTRDRDAASRGVGAIASRDHAQPSKRAWQQARMLAATRQRDHAMAQVARGALGLVPDPNRSVVDRRAANAPKISPKATSVTTKMPDGTIVHDHRTGGAGTAPNPLAVLISTTLKGITAATPPGTIPTPAPSTPPPSTTTGPSPVIGPFQPPIVVAPQPAPPATAAAPSTTTGSSSSAGVMTSAPPPTPITAPPITLPDIPDPTDVSTAPAPAASIDTRTLWIAGGIAAALGAYFLFRKRGSP